MFFVTYNNINDNFELKFQTHDYPWDVFEDIIPFFKKIYLEYFEDNWLIPGKRIHEILAWCNYYKWNYELCVNSQKALKCNNWFPSETKFFRGECFDSSILSENVKLFEFQKKDINWSISRNRIYNGNDPGLGKTIESACIFGHWLNKEKIQGILLICVSGLEYHWKHEILDKLNLFKENDFSIIDNKNKFQPFEKNQDKKIIIIPSHLWEYVAVSYRYKTQKEVPRKRSNFRWKMYQDIRKEWGKKNIALVVDEAHEFQNSKSLRSKSLAAYSLSFDYRLLLSATPWTNDFTRIWFAMNLLDPAIFSTTEEAFKIYLSDNIGLYGTYDINKNQLNEYKVEEAKKKIKHNFFKRLKSETPEVKTSKILKPIYFQIADLQIRMMEIMREEELLKIEERNKGFLTYNLIANNFPYTMQVIDNPLLLEGKLGNSELNKLLFRWKFNHDPRIVYLDSHIKDVIDNIGEKIVIYDSHPKTLDMLEERYSKYKPLKIHGQVIPDSPKIRKHKENLFNNLDSPHKIILLGYQTSSAGLNLQHGSRRIIFFSQPWNTIHFKQASERTDRMTSVHDSIVDIFVMDKTLDIYRFNKNIGRLKMNDDFLAKGLPVGELRKILSGKID